MQSSTLDAAQIERVGAEANQWLDRMFALSRAARGALDESDTERVMANLEQRDRIIEQLDPLLRTLVDARSTLAGGAAQSAAARTIGPVMATVEAAAQRVHSADADLAGRLQQGRNEILKELDALDTSDAAPTPYPRPAPPAGPHFDLRR